jgi:hypothetical protein
MEFIGLLHNISVSINGRNRNGYGSDINAENIGAFVHMRTSRCVGVRPEAASFGPGRRFRFFAILGIDALRPAFGGIAKTLPENLIGKPKSTISERTLYPSVNSKTMHPSQNDR